MGQIKPKHPSVFSVDRDRITKVLTLSQTTNFRLFQIERACRQFLVRRKWQKVLQKGRKHCGSVGKGEIAHFQNTCTADT